MIQGTFILNTTNYIYNKFKDTKHLPLFLKLDVYTQCVYIHVCIYAHINYNINYK